MRRQKIKFSQRNSHDKNCFDFFALCDKKSIFKKKTKKNYPLKKHQAKIPSQMRHFYFFIPIFKKWNDQKKKVAQWNYN